MATLVKTFEIDAPLDRVWARVADVGAVSDLFAMLADASVDGDVRTCNTVDRKQLKELIVSIDDIHKRLVYSVTESPFGFHFHSASWQLEPAGPKTRLVWHTDVKPDAMVAALEPVIDSEIPNIVRGLAA